MIGLIPKPSGKLANTNRRGLVDARLGTNLTAYNLRIERFGAQLQSLFPLKKGRDLQAIQTRSG